MKKKLLALMLVAGSSVFAQGQFSAGVSVGAPGYYPPPGAYDAPPPCGPGSVWIDGYTDASGYPVNGYCAVPPYSGAYWVAPGYFGGRFVAGYWGRGYAPGFGFRGGYGGGYAFRGGYDRDSHFQGGYSNGYRSAAPNVRSQGGYNNFRSQGGASNSFHSQGSYRGGGSAMRGGGGSGHGGHR